MELHEQYMQETENVGSKEFCLCLTERNSKRESEMLIIAAQEQAIRTNLIKVRIDKTLLHHEDQI